MASKVATWEQFYDGSRSFQFVAEATHMPIDQVNFVLGQLAAVLLSFFLRTRLPPLSYSWPDAGRRYPQHLHQDRHVHRHRFALLAGLALTYFCFGRQVLLAVGLGVVCYLLLVLLPAVSVHKVTLLVCMALLSVTHLYRQAMQQAAFVIDITGPLMLMVQRATSVAYSLHDGLTKRPDKMTAMQRTNAITERPSALVYFSYLLNFQSILAGPYLLFTDYQAFMHGTDHFARAVVLAKSVEQAKEQQNLKKSTFFDGNSSTTLHSATSSSDGPSPTAASLHPAHEGLLQSAELRPTQVAVRKLCLGGLFGLSTVLLAPLFPVSGVTGGPAFASQSFPMKLLLVVVSTTLARHLYYTAWLLAEGACNIGGLGYMGTDACGRHLWGGASNVDIMGVEFGTSLRIILDSWNCKTVVWLRYAAYERLPSKYQIHVLGTYLLSSTWHGFYPGYYCTFLMGALLTTSSRVVRRSVRPRVLSMAGGEEAPLMRAYHVFTWGVARLLLSYSTFSFVLLRMYPTLAVYGELYYYLHVLALLGIFVTPVLLPPPPKRLQTDPDQGCPNLNNNCVRKQEAAVQQQQDCDTTRLTEPPMTSEESGVKEKSL